VFVNKIIVLVLAIKYVVSHTNGTNMVGVNLHGRYKTHTVDCGLQAMDYGLGIKHKLMYKTQTKHYRLGIKRVWTQV